MDPNAAWGNLCDLLDDPMGLSEVDEARELVDGLLRWLARGGFMPALWQGGRQSLLRILGAVSAYLDQEEDRLSAAEAMSGGYQYHV